MDDSDEDQDYVGEDEDESESSDDGEPAAKTTKEPQDSRTRTVTKKKEKKVGRIFKAARRPGEVLVFLDPPEEKAEGDTDRDSGNFEYNLHYFSQCCGLG